MKIKLNIRVTVEKDIVVDSEHYEHVGDNPSPQDIADEVAREFAAVEENDAFAYLLEDPGILVSAEATMLELEEANES